MEMTPTQIHEKLQEFGVSKLDAELVVNCINKKSSFTWLNTDPITQDQINVVNDFIAQNDMGVKVILSEVPYQSKFIWDVKITAPKPAQAPASPQSQAPAPASGQSPAPDLNKKNLGPEGRFKSLSELGL